MTNNTTRGFQVLKQNITPNTTGAGGTFGATMEGYSSYLGTFVCNGATPVTVTDPNVTPNCGIVITLKTVGGTVGAIPAIQTITAGTGFTIAGTASDTSTYSYVIIPFAN